MFDRNPLILLWFLYICIEFSNGQLPSLNEGASCVIPKTGQQGVCKLRTNCTLPCSDTRFVRCGISPIGIPIVCCPQITTFNRTISAIKCEEYKEFACDRIYVSNVIGRPKIAVNIPNCAYTAIPLVAGGEKAVRREFPHMALIGYNDEEHNTTLWLCGGTLISEQFVLSAAHCFETNAYGPPTYVRLGEHDLSLLDEAKILDVKIIERHRHPEYDSSQKYNDIGLFKLEHKIEFNGAIRPACLPEQQGITTKKSIATGWGRDEWNVPSNVLMKVTLDNFSQDECDNQYGVEDTWPLGILEKSQLCAGSLTLINNTCQGDSGGPLQIYHESYFCTYTVVGVTSFGYPCRIKGIPGVYVKVHAYLEWIENIVWSDQ